MPTPMIIWTDNLVPDEWRTSVLHSDAPDPGTWGWPPRD